MTSPLAALNDRYRHTCFRLETLQDYAGVSGEEQLSSRLGRPAQVVAQQRCEEAEGSRQE